MLQAFIGAVLILTSARTQTVPAAVFLGCQSAQANDEILILLGYDHL
jgi:hypothetical protein